MELVGTARNTVPIGAQTGAFAGADGMRLRYAWWRSALKGWKGTVCIFPGRGEYIEKYFETVADLRRRAFTVAAMDWRGQGGSDRLLKNPRKGHVEDFADYDRDVARFMEEVVLPDCPPPYFAIGHSMGGHILLRSACRRDCWFDRMVLVGPMLQIAALPMPAPICSAISEIASYAGFGEMFVPGGKSVAVEELPFENNVLTTDEGRFYRNQAVLEIAPELGIGSPTVGWLRAALSSISAMNEPDFPPQVHVPTLLIAAANDRVVSNRAIEDMSALLKAGSQIVIRGAQHEILQEQDGIREQFWAAFDAFIPGTR